mmetsp:Transcript_35068/g.64047  ORF Transcript_35068/g.64047 Transcript_35068/m.64047 type:complete len:330 (-) Transcript_35068:21-1010(-)
MADLAWHAIPHAAEAVVRAPVSSRLDGPQDSEDTESENLKVILDVGGGELQTSVTTADVEYFMRRTATCANHNCHAVVSRTHAYSVMHGLETWQTDRRQLKLAGTMLQGRQSLSTGGTELAMWDTAYDVTEEDYIVLDATKGLPLQRPHTEVLTKSQLEACLARAGPDGLEAFLLARTQLSLEDIWNKKGEEFLVADGVRTWTEDAPEEEKKRMQQALYCDLFGQKGDVSIHGGRILPHNPTDAACVYRHTMNSVAGCSGCGIWIPRTSLGPEAATNDQGSGDDDPGDENDPQGPQSWLLAGIHMGCPQQKAQQTLFNSMRVAADAVEV